MECLPKAQSATCWKNKEIQRLLPGPLKDAQDVWAWRRCYSMQEVNSALSKVQLVGYSQKVLAKSLVPSEIKPGISVATVSAVLHSKDNKHILQPVPKPVPVPPTKKRKRVQEEPPEHLAQKPLLSGAVPLEPFLTTLHKHGIVEMKAEETADGHILHLQAEDTLIQLEEDGTHIVCDNEPLRTTSRDLVFCFLQKF